MPSPSEPVPPPSEHVSVPLAHMSVPSTSSMRRRVIAGLVAVAAATSLVVVSACSDDPAVPNTSGPTTPAVAGPVPTTAVAPEGIDGVVAWSGLSRGHVEGALSYPVTPPVGGDHNPVWLNCGVYDAPVEDENAVHSLEHGAVWIAYSEDLPTDAVATVRALASGAPFVIVSPYPGLTDAVVATAWERQLRVADPADPRLAQFVQTYVQGPQTPELGAPCTGGTGTPGT